MCPFCGGQSSRRGERAEAPGSSRVSFLLSARLEAKAAAAWSDSHGLGSRGRNGLPGSKPSSACCCCRRSRPDLLPLPRRLRLPEAQAALRLPAADARGARAILAQAWPPWRLWGALLALMAWHICRTPRR